MADLPISSDPTNADAASDPNLLSRRQALVRGTLATAAIALSGPLLSACSDDRKEDHPQVTTGVVNVGKAQDFPAGIVSTKYMAQYGIALANDSGTVLAIRPKCTHRGCIAAWEDEQNQFVCPCHGSRYNILGQVVQGPAKKNLPAVTAVKKNDGTLTVDLGPLYPPAT